MHVLWCLCRGRFAQCQSVIHKGTTLHQVLRISSSHRMDTLGRKPLTVLCCNPSPTGLQGNAAALYSLAHDRRCVTRHGAYIGVHAPEALMNGIREARA